MSAAKFVLIDTREVLDTTRRRQKPSRIELSGRIGAGATGRPDLGSGQAEARPNGFAGCGQIRSRLGPPGRILRSRGRASSNQRAAQGAVAILGYGSHSVMEWRVISRSTLSSTGTSKGLGWPRALLRFGRIIGLARVGSRGTSDQLARGVHLDSALAPPVDSSPATDKTAGLDDEFLAARRPPTLAGGSTDATDVATITPRSAPEEHSGVPRETVLADADFQQTTGLPGGTATPSRSRGRPSRRSLPTLPEPETRPAIRK